MLTPATEAPVNAQAVRNRATETSPHASVSTCHFRLKERPRARLIRSA
jgi:hypothetical protein